MVRAITQIIGASIERRTLPDFDYDVAPLIPKRKGSHPVRGRQTQRTKPARASKGRAQRGAFAWLSSQGKQPVASRGMQST
ncbi:MAG: hypothetical protein B6240_01080 [Desulfobacteraceae bacterium 4572_87]|nr:MAG: hypothetical protein B6240_01080 [Desulfobacteraceae bacterium 4572_87]